MRRSRRERPADGAPKPKRRDSAGWRAVAWQHVGGTTDRPARSGPASPSPAAKRDDQAPLTVFLGVDAAVLHDPLKGVVHEAAAAAGVAGGGVAVDQLLRGRGGRAAGLTECKHGGKRRGCGARGARDCNGPSPVSCGTRSWLIAKRLPAAGRQASRPTCSLSDTSLPVWMALMPSTEPVALNAQHDPHWGWGPGGPGGRVDGRVIKCGRAVGRTIERACRRGSRCRPVPKTPPSPRPPLPPPPAPTHRALVLDLSHRPLLPPVHPLLDLHIGVPEARAAGPQPRRARGARGGGVEAEARPGELLPGQVGVLIQVKLRRFPAGYFIDSGAAPAACRSIPGTEPWALRPRRSACARAAMQKQGRALARARLPSAVGSCAPPPP